MLNRYKLAVNQVTMTTANFRNYDFDLTNTIYRRYWNVAAHKWKVHNRKIEIISFVVKFRYCQLLDVGQCISRRSICICGIFYFRFIEIYEINTVTNL